MGKIVDLREFQKTKLERELVDLKEEVLELTLEQIDSAIDLLKGLREVVEDGVSPECHEAIGEPLDNIKVIICKTDVVVMKDLLTDPELNDEERNRIMGAIKEVEQFIEDFEKELMDETEFND